ncbi:hypothetical protein LMH87_001724 [Akanthomyces muscarius]|uniref:Uncharacterized protein n=1 Tax=Akanthomyces muscarius TaxID=2231603 RepID=A0A9W8Q6A3_AKAMU|nr:hypothetical protein LMH87_001724 [Akanthomyces muscarius]KAJ4147184.1 hypothetical protein LMH87_001724 [Akanthomyces muscarius]
MLAAIKTRRVMRPSRDSGHQIYLGLRCYDLRPFVTCPFHAAFPSLTSFQGRVSLLTQNSATANSYKVPVHAVQRGHLPVLVVAKTNYA